MKILTFNLSLVALGLSLGSPVAEVSAPAITHDTKATMESDANNLCVTISKD